MNVLKVKSAQKMFSRILGFTALLVVAGTARAADDEWQFSLSPLFLWGVSVDGDSTINDVDAPVDLDFSDDILDNMEGVFTVHFEARRRDWGFFAEYQYIDLDPEAEVQAGPLSAKADIGFEESTAELGAAWAFYENDCTRWEFIGGARYTDQDLKVDAELSNRVSATQRSIKLEGGDDWWHAFGGVRVFHALGKKWSFIGRADYGYGDSDNTAVNLAFQFDYRFSDWGSAFIGARYLEYDYENTNGDVVKYAYDAAKQGPLAGITLHW